MSREANQRLVDEAYAHVNAVGKPSVDKRGRCVYGGVGCAFSPAVLDGFKSQADRIKGGNDASSLIKDSPHFLKDWAQKIDSGFAQYVQFCHDDNKHSEDFLYYFNKGIRYLCDKENYKFPGDKNA